MSDVYCRNCGMRLNKRFGTWRHAMTPVGPVPCRAATPDTGPEAEAPPPEPGAPRPPYGPGAPPPER